MDNRHYYEKTGNNSRGRNGRKVFVNNILCPFFCSKGIYNSIQCFKTKHSHGGVSKYSYIKKDILNIIYEKDVVVSMMIDFYRLPSDIPGFNDLKVTQTHQEQANLLEAKIKEDLEDTQNHKFDNFIPLYPAS